MTLLSIYIVYPRINSFNLSSSTTTFSIWHSVSMIVCLSVCLAEQAMSDCVLPFPPTLGSITQILSPIPLSRSEWHLIQYALMDSTMSICSSSLSLGMSISCSHLCLNGQRGNSTNPIITGFGPILCDMRDWYGKNPLESELSKCVFEHNERDKSSSSKSAPDVYPKDGLLNTWILRLLYISRWWMTDGESRWDWTKTFLYLNFESSLYYVLLFCKYILTDTLLLLTLSYMLCCCCLWGYIYMAYSFCSGKAFFYSVVLCCFVFCFLWRRRTSRSLCLQESDKRLLLWTELCTSEIDSWCWVYWWAGCQFWARFSAVTVIGCSVIEMMNMRYWIV